MQEPIPEQPNRSLPEQFASFGEPEFVFSPTPGLTSLGVAVGLVFAIGAFAGAVFCSEGIEVRLFAVLLGCAAAALVYYVWRLRNWRLLICPKGLIQIGAWRTEAITWSEMTHVVAVCREGTDIHEEVTIVSSAGRVAINGTTNLHTWRQMLKTVTEAARRHGVSVHTVFVKVSDK